MKLKSMLPCQHVHLLSDRETAQLGVSHLLLFPSSILTSVWSNLVGSAGPLPALPPMADPPETTMPGMLEPSTFPHPLSLLGVADAVPASGSFSILKWERKWCPTDGRGQRETHHQPSHAAAQLQGQQQRLVVGTCWGCAGTTTASQYHFSAPCVYTKNMCRYVLYSHGRGHTQQTARGWLKKTVTCKQAANRAALLTSWCSASYPKPREREKQAKELHPCLFHVAQFQLHDVVQKEVSIMSPYRFFLLHKIRVFFFFLCRKIYASFECLNP